MAKKKKEKVVYVDDGRTIADMSGVPSGRIARRKGFGEKSASFKDVWHTYWAAVKMMLLPTAVFAGGLVVIYLILWLIFKIQ